MARDLMYDLNLYPDENGNSGSLYSLHFPQCFAAALFKMGYNRTKIVKLLRGQ